MFHTGPCGSRPCQKHCQVDVDPGPTAPAEEPGQVKPGFHSDVCAFYQGSIASNAIARDPRGSALGTTEVPVSGRLFMRNRECMSEKGRAGLA